MPVGPEGGSQVLEQYDRQSDGTFLRKALMGVVYVPLTDKYRQWPRYISVVRIIQNVFCAADFHNCVADDLFLFPVMSSDCSMVSPAGDGAGAVVQKALRPEKDRITPQHNCRDHSNS